MNIAFSVGQNSTIIRSACRRGIVPDRIILGMQIGFVLNVTKILKKCSVGHFKGKVIFLMAITHFGMADKPTPISVWASVIH